MKTVVKTKQNQTITVNECRTSLYYGVDCPTYDLRYKRSFVMCMKDGFRIVSTQELTGTYSTNISSPCNNLSEFLESLINHNAKVYQFETFKELSKWLNS